MKCSAIRGAWLCLMAWSTAYAAPVTIPNAGFETQSPELTASQFTHTLTPWQETGGPGAAAGFFEYIPGFAAEGTDHLGMELGHDVWQDLTGNYQSNTVYTLTVSAGNRASQTTAGNASSYFLSTSTAALYAGGSFNAATGAAAGSFADAPPITLDTVEEPGAVGRPIRILLQARGAGRSHFDNIRLDATATAQNGRPIGNTAAATAITASGATITGSISSIGSAAPSVTLYYGPADAGSNPADWPLTKVLPGTFTGSFSTLLTDLTPGVRTYYRARFTNASGSTWSLNTRFFDTPLPPAVVNLPATNFSPVSATAGARVTAYSGLPPAVTLYFGTSDGGTTPANWAQSISLGSVPGTASGSLTGLIPGTTYHYRAFASNTAGSAWAPSSLTFTTSVVTPPTIANRTVSNITPTSATLEADVLTTGLAAPAVTFHYGPVDGGDTAAAWANTVSAGTAAGRVKAVISSLTPGAVYYFRASATNSAGTGWAPATTSFTAAAVVPPTVRTLPATHVRSTMATLNGEVTATGHQTPGVTLYWGPSDGGANPAAWANAAALGNATGLVSRVLTGLTPGNTYHFRTFASNSAGGSWAPSSQSFPTLTTEAPAGIVINEVHYAPADKTRFQEFIELHNPDTVSVNLTGWRFTSGIDYTFGNVIIPPGGYFCVVQDPARFAATWPAAAANSAGPFTGKLSNSGELIELRNAAGQVVASVDYGQTFPWPTASRGAGPSMELLHPSLDPGLGGSWRRAPSTPTPGAVNASKLAVYSTAPPAIRHVNHSPDQPASNTPVVVTATVTDPDGVGSVALRYQLVSPGAYIRKSDAAFNSAANWTNLNMLDDGTGGDAVAGDSIYTATIPASAQTHRRLVRYQITVTDTPGNTIRVPYADDEQPNFAYFVYDAIPAWSGAMRPIAFNGFAATAIETYPQSLMESIEPWHLIANEANIISCQYESGSNGAPFQGTLVYRGKVYDHIVYQVRGIGSTYQSGKNKWGLKFNRGRDFQPYDNWGRPYAETWNSLGLNACASPWAAVNRGAAGIDEAVPFRAFELAGVPALRTSFVHWRVIRRAAEVNPAASIITGDPMGGSLRGQYSGDLWGLYLALEPTEGNFLDERGLGDGNIYSIEGNGGDKKHQGDTQPTGTTDWNAFSSALAQTNQTEAWYRANVDLPALYSFLAMNRLTGNTDVRPGDNYRFYHRPEDNRWVILPYDLDMMFIAAHHWGGTMDNGIVVAGAPNVIRAVSRHPAIALEFRNRCRELLSLLAEDATPTGGQIGQLFQEYARMVNPPGAALTWADLDAAMWNLHPRTTGNGSNTEQSSHRGNFFRNTYRDGPRGTGGSITTESWIRSLKPSGDFGDHESLTQWFTNFTTNTYPAGAAAWVRKATSASGSGTDSDVNRQKGYGYKYLEWESLYGGYVNANTNPVATLADTAYPFTPVILASGSPDFAANDLRFTSSDFNDPQGSATAAAVQWRVGEISAPGIPGYDASLPSVYEITSVWTSPEIALTTPVPAEVRVPASAVVPGRTYRARVRHKDTTGRWSYWSPPVQFIAASYNTSSYQDSLRITEINYDPSPVTSAELSHPSWNTAWNAQQFEFLELTNISAQPVDLTDVRFTKGIDYDFPAGTTLAPGARIIVAKNPTAFAIRYGNGLPVAPGGYDPDSLSNSGEELKLSYGAGITIFSFIYDDDYPWPNSPNGDGPSLVLINPEKPGLDHGNAMEWRPSTAINGNPGTDDRISYAAWAANFPGLGSASDDDDGDGLTNLMEFSLGSSPIAGSPEALPSAAAAADRFQFTVTYAPVHGGHTRHVEFSSDMVSWTPSGTLTHRAILPDGRFTDTWQSNVPIAPGTPRQFGRLRISTP